MTGKRILVVDDEPNVVFSLIEKLEKEGFEPRGVRNGAEAVDLYKADSFDLVLTDLKMPRMDGLEVLKAIMQYDPDALVVMITAFGTVDRAIEALKRGARDFITKPFDLNWLVAKVRVLLDEHRHIGVRGNLRELGLTNIIHINCTEINQAQLLIRRRGQLGKIYFEDGDIVHAALDDQAGEEVVYELLSWEDGSFSLKQGVAPPQHTIETGWKFLLLEGLRRIDEKMIDDPIMRAERKLMEIVGFSDDK